MLFLNFIGQIPKYPVFSIRYQPQNFILFLKNLSTIFDIIPILRDRKQANIFFSKNRQVVFSARYQP